ncbi:MAG: DnaJ domain-containing protein [Bacteroidaceae bacterium]|nr:DnaJ domain-containing protein [Bacteroidaceae bacterium]
MASKKELYTILGVDPSASDAEIKSAYDHLIAQTPQDSPLYSRIEEAYAVLSDMDSRAAYDITGKVNKGGVRKHRVSNPRDTEKARYNLNTLFLAGAAVTTILFILQFSGAIGSLPFYIACGVSLLIKIAEYILRLIP